MSDRKKTDSAQHSTSLLPPSAGPFIRATEATRVRISTIPVDADTLLVAGPLPCSPPALPAWVFPVTAGPQLAGRDQATGDSGRMDDTSPQGTLSALRRIVEPLGYLIRVSEWWEFDGSPGTFTIEIGALEPE